VVWYQKRICDCGFGEFVIKDLTSGQIIKCAITDDSFDSSAFGLDGHKTQAFAFDLKDVFGINNAGKYSIQASGWLPMDDSSARPVFTNIVTPPIIFTLTAKLGTNTPP
jgi:hypothetical protein